MAKNNTTQGKAWSRLIPDDEWDVYREVIDAVEAKGCPFALGGGFALANYTGRWRDTKDIDLVVLPGDRDDVVEVLSSIGFEDFYARSPYERYWIYRSTRKSFIVDVIWGMRNRRAVVDKTWLEQAPTIQVRDREVRVLAPEFLVWGKLYVIIRDRSDWPDVFNILYGAGPTMDWEGLIKRLGTDVPLLAAALRVFGWLCPGRSQELPEGIWKKLHVPKPEPGPAFIEDRLRLLDERVWLAPTVPPGVQLEF